MRAYNMTLIENHIELNIYHLHQLLRYDVIQTLDSQAVINFKVIYKGDYQFTLVLKNDTDISFKLSWQDRNLDISIDWTLYAKIEAALFSVFLKEIPS